MYTPSSKNSGTRMLDSVELKSEIRRAYTFYEQRGKADRFALEGWLQAQAEWLEEYLQQHAEASAAGERIAQTLGSLRISG